MTSGNWVSTDAACAAKYSSPEDGFSSKASQTICSCTRSGRPLIGRLTFMASQSSTFSRRAVLEYTQHLPRPSLFLGTFWRMAMPRALSFSASSPTGVFERLICATSGQFVTLPPPNNLEDQLLADGHEALLREVLEEAGSAHAHNCPEAELRGY